MVPTRRHVLAASGVTLLAGCLDSDSEQPDPSGSTELNLPQAYEQVLSALPQLVNGHSLQQVLLFGSSDRPTTPDMNKIADQLGFPTGTVECYGFGNWFSDTSNTQKEITAIGGSFDAAAVEESNLQSEVEIDQTGIYVEDGLVIAADEGEQAWKAGVNRVREIAGDSGTGLVSSMSPVLGSVVDKDSSLVRLIKTTLTLESFEDVGFEHVDTVAVGNHLIDDYTLQTQYAVRFNSADAATESRAEAVLSRPNSQFGRYSIEELDISYQYTGERTIVATFSHVSPRLVSDNSPDAAFSLQDDRTTLTQTGTEPVAPANLELRVDREQRTPPWADREDPITPGTSFAVEFDLFQLIEIIWTDPEYDGVNQQLFSKLTHIPTGDVFESAYDPDTETVTTEYTLDTETRAEWFTVRQSLPGESGERMRRDLETFVGETLTPGESLQIEDVNYGDQIEIRVEYHTSSGPSSSGVTAVGSDSDAAGGDSEFSVGPPEKLSFEDGDGTVTIRYRGGEPVPAEKYQCRYKSRSNAGEPTQFSDQYDRLTDGDGITVDAAVGDQLIFERPAPDRSTPTYLGSYLVVPEARFDVSYDASAEAITVTHAGGSQLDADQLGLDIQGSPVDADKPNLWDGQYDTVEPGDAVTVAVGWEPREVRVLFNGGVIAAVSEL